MRVNMFYMFFFKQKTAYEMRISDWSSDVCSSDLFDWKLLRGFRHSLPWGLSGGLDSFNVREAIAITGTPLVDVSSGVESRPGKIGRASCRERVCQYV